MNFLDKLLSVSRSNDSLLCVGLDPDPAYMPVPDVLAFNRAIIDATCDLVCAYKPNVAFYEALGIDGLKALGGTVEYIREKAPNLVVIGDAKRGDVGNTAEAYAKALFDVWGFDAATVNPWGGHDALQPFLDYTDRGVLIWCRSSNPGAGDFQDLFVDGNRPVFQVVANKAKEWNASGNVGLVVGATYPEDLKGIRDVCPDMPILIPGVGAQGGNLEASIANGIDSNGQLAIISASRGVIYASKGPDFAEAARKAAQDLRDRINVCRRAR